jgi:hypothetical protein
MGDVDAAPSILNTKPWFFGLVSGNRIELRPRWERHLKVIDPRHRELFISCGAALFNLRMAIRVTGHDPVVWLLPGRTGATAVCEHCGNRCGTGDLLASVEVVLRRAHPGTATEQRLYEAIPERHTVREPFSHGLQMNMLIELERVARMEGADARLLHRRETERVLRSAAQTDKELTLDSSYLAEINNWTGGDPGSGLGVAAAKFGPKPKGQHHPPVRDFGPGSPDPREVKKFEKHPQLIALETQTDTPSDWIRAGQALQRLLLTATCYGVETSFLTQHLEAGDKETGTCQPAHQWWQWPRPAQMIIRVGSQ